MRLHFANYIGGMRSYMPSPAFGGQYALDTIYATCMIMILIPMAG